MPRGYEWAVYQCDDDSVFALSVDSDYALQPQRGWGSAEGLGLVPMPRGWAARYVVGIEPAGRHHRAIVSSLLADLWTGERTDFDIVDTDGQLQTCIVYKRVQERVGRRP